MFHLGNPVNCCLPLEFRKLSTELDKTGISVFELTFENYDSEKYVVPIGLRYVNPRYLECRE